MTQRLPTITAHISEEGNPDLEQAFNFLGTLLVREKQDDMIVTLYHRIMMCDDNLFSAHDCTNRGAWW